MGLFPLTVTALLAASLPLATAARTYSVEMADSFITRGVTASRGYTQAVLYRGFETVYNKTSDAKYYNYIKSQVDSFVGTSGKLTGYSETSESLDDIRIGPTLLFLYSKTGDKRYKTAADQLRAQLRRQSRTPSGGFWHRKPAYPNQMWLDGIYMADVFYAQYTSWFQPTNTSAWNDIILQYDLIEQHCRDTTSGLLFHGYDESKVAVWANPTTGACPNVWDRAVGWYVMALLDTLDYFPKSHSGYNKLLSYYKTLADALVKSFDTTKNGWWLVMNAPYPGKKGNYIESSGTAMFTYGLLKGVRLGYISGSRYTDVAYKAYDQMTQQFVKNATGGTLNWEGTVEVGSLSSNGSYEVSQLPFLNRVSIDKALTWFSTISQYR